MIMEMVVAVEDEKEDEKDGEDKNKEKLDSR